MRKYGDPAKVDAVLERVRMELAVYEASPTGSIPLRPELAALRQRLYKLDNKVKHEFKRDAEAPLRHCVHSLVEKTWQELQPAWMADLVQQQQQLLLPAAGLQLPLPPMPLPLPAMSATVSNRQQQLPPLSLPLFSAGVAEPVRTGGPQDMRTGSAAPAAGGVGNSAPLTLATLLAESLPLPPGLLLPMPALPLLPPLPQPLQPPPLLLVGAGPATQQAQHQQLPAQAQQAQQQGQAQQATAQAEPSSPEACSMLRPAAQPPRAPLPPSMLGLPHALAAGPAASLRVPAPPLPGPLTAVAKGGVSPC